MIPGPGLLAFTAAVVLTILASSSFDSTLIWTDPSPEPPATEPGPPGPLPAATVRKRRWRFPASGSSR